MTPATTSSTPKAPPRPARARTVQAAVPVVLTDPATRARDLPGGAVRAAVLVATSAWVVMLTVPVATTGALTPGYWQTVCAVLAVRYLTGGTGIIKARRRADGTIR